MKYFAAIVLSLFMATAAIAQTGDVRVTIYPQGINAAWSINGLWLGSGMTSFDLEPGKYQIVFRAVPGLTTPQPIPVTVTPDSYTNLTATYMHDPGELQVSIQPYNARIHGAMVRIDDGDWISPGEILQLEEGFYTVHFSKIPGWHTPHSQNIHVRAGVRRAITSVYRRDYDVQRQTQFFTRLNIYEIRDTLVDGVMLDTVLLRLHPDGTFSILDVVP